MNTMSIRAVVPLVGLGLLALSSPVWTGAASAEDAHGHNYRFTDKVVLAYYYIWFTKGWFDGTEGNAGRALEDVHPLLGPYDSANRRVIEAHVKMATRARIDAFAVSWWYDDAEGARNRILGTVYETAAAHDLGVTINLEAAELTLPQIERCLRFFLETYSRHPATLKIDGQPALLIWGTWQHDPHQWQHLFDRLRADGLAAVYLASQQLDPKYLGPLRSLEQYAAVDTADDELAGFYQRQRRKVDEFNRTHPDKPARWHATIMPGFDERKIPGRDRGPGGAGWKDRGDGRYYRRTFEAALSSRPDWIHITSFNELAEHTHIEPTGEFGWTYIDLTARFVDEFKRGQR